MFAGPNGSGKSTLKAYLPTNLLGSYLNPDEIEQGVRDRGFLDVAQHGVSANGPEVLQFFRDSALLAEAGLTAAAHAFSFSNGRPKIGRLEVNSYLAAVAVEKALWRLQPSRRGLAGREWLGWMVSC